VNSKNLETEINKNNKSQNKKFNPKIYLGKDRVYRSVPGSSRVSKLHVWDSKRKEYLFSDSCKSYMARRYEPSLEGVLTRKTQFFGALEEARKWQAGVQENTNSTADPSGVMTGPKLSDVVCIWKKRAFAPLAHSTQIQYEKLLSLHFKSILGLGVREITPQRVDLWIDELRDVGRSNSRRLTLNHELKLLSTLLKYYREDKDDMDFHFPIKERHWRNCILQKKKKKSSKDFSVDEFFKFREQLSRGIEGSFFSSLATIQYFQALRISEAAAIHRDDVKLVPGSRSQSRLLIQRSVCWPRKKGVPSYIQLGFKNSDSFDDGVKEQPVFPESYEALQLMLERTRFVKSDFLFELGCKHLEYRQIQHAYDIAFRRAGLPYRGTHVLRHGGCRNLYNESGDLSVAQQLLGDKSEEAARVYAQRKVSALTEVAEVHWQKKLKSV